ncbi:Coiled-coil domain-containing protein 106 [Triplophysa tibetana]|uniref:Coiled-coil domain-containing protein 106 n=1 Tax=Triplophysa tibetana TaxID=1572043 RepID=A0A5A9PIU6_9TELE|nr:Coiled-coil domain-containing protein 106 [Triplophysa tibetana]
MENSDKSRKGPRTRDKRNDSMEMDALEKTCVSGTSAQTQQQVVARYNKILRHFSRGGTMSAAFKHVGVDRNTVVVNAPITELYIAAPDKYKELLKKHSSQIQLSAFATQCAGVIKEDPAVEDTIKAFNASGKLLPLKRK